MVPLLLKFDLTWTQTMAGLNLGCNVEQDLIKSFKIISFYLFHVSGLFGCSLEEYSLSSGPISMWHKTSFHLSGIVLKRISLSKSLFLSKVCLSVPHALF